MLRRYLTLLFIILFALTGCARHQTKSDPSPKNKKTATSSFKVKERKIPNLERVDVKGLFNVNLRSGYQKSGIILRGNSSDLNEVVSEKKGSTLNLFIKKGYPKFGPIGVEIRAGSLKSFSYQGTGTIVGKNLHSRALDLTINNPGQTSLDGSIGLRKVNLSGGGSIIFKGISSRYMKLEIAEGTKVMGQGAMNLSSVEIKGGGWLSLYWIKAPILAICGTGNANIQLAGFVDKLDVELWGTSRFKGRYLRARNAFVKTHDRSVAEITALRHQHALATDASDIYFYHIPKTKSDFMAYEGSILDMRDWNYPFLEDYERYNKETH